MIKKKTIKERRKGTSCAFLHVEFSRREQACIQKKSEITFQVVVSAISHHNLDLSAHKNLHIKKEFSE